ncbi:MAG: N(4)-(beta-N-acetylglucosaminyl)-L-asparaginase [Chitinophagaceae bacterium]|nr:N(4)-(beta-N-acetylglucosaminyl)-L-asparaginase [Chitinophagaceae bacterium]
MQRRKFLQLSTLIAPLLATKNAFSFSGTGVTKPIVISTWAPNVKANAEAWKTLSSGGRALDAVEAGVKIPEADPDDTSVGYGGLPDRDGIVTLDACIMDEFANIGSVMALENIMHPISVARLVMEKTPHVQLAGDGALQFALSMGFEKINLLTPGSEKAWKEWLKTSKYDPNRTNEEINKRIKNDEKHLPYPWPVAMNHDTIGMLAMDVNGNLSGACTTSGMAFKMRGRVGDSPIIGAGLFVDNEIGAATSTGVGEEVVRMCGSHTVVELMRQGYSPEIACRKAVERIVKLRGNKIKGIQVGFLALNKKGEFGGYSLEKGFNYAIQTNAGSKVYDGKYIKP